MNQSAPRKNPYLLHLCWWLVGVSALGTWPSLPARAKGIEPTVYAHAGLDHFYNLEYPEAVEDFESALEGDPDNLIYYNFLTNTYLFEELHHLGQLEGNLYASSNRFLEKEKPEPDAERLKLIEDRIDEVKRRCQERLDKNPRDVHALYALGTAHGMDANLAFTIRKAYLDALRAGGKANDLHRKVLKLDSSFADAKLIPGLYEYVVGSIPTAVKWIVFLMGYHGSKEKGIELLQETMMNAKWVSSDAAILLAVIYTREKEHDYARQLLRKVSEYYPRNPLYFMEVGRSYEREKKTEKALQIYQQAADRLEAGKPGYDKLPRDRVYYEIGMLSQKTGQFDNALQAFGRLTQHEDSDTRLKASAALHRGDIFQAKKQPEKARAEYQLAASLPHEELRAEARKRLQKLQ